MAMKLKYLSSIDEDFIIKRCSQKLDTSVEKLVVDFEGGWNPEIGNYCRKLVEFCSGEAVSELCHNIEGNINVGSFSRLIYDMMLAWERPSYYNEEDTTIGRQIWRMSIQDGLQTLTTPWYQFRRDNNLMVQDEVVFYYRLNQGVWEIILRKNIGWDEDQST
ncbi:hypothetical protein GmHk_13G036154 [Glycine max]|nr:hypothetical protein GmHk_13G036154 [Glycine max]